MRLLGRLYYLILSQSFLYHVFAFEALPRWGQATVLINDALFVYGGKTDQFNSFSYTSAPPINDILYLSLASPFSASSPPWIQVSSSANSTTSQGPALAWSTLSAFNTSEILLFGGQPGPNSDIVILDAADSAELLNVFSRLSPVWIPEPLSWVGEPIRRIRHSAVTAPTGLIYIFGGEKADGSGNGFSDHFMFDPNAPSFTLLPSQNAPPDIYGHVSIILPEGRILVFGGFSQSQGGLLPLSIIWILDITQSPPSWSIVNTSTAAVPSPRMDFAAVLIADGRIIIHGGCDSAFQSNFPDGWVLDTTQNPMTWTQVEALSQVGARRDHFAVSSGDQVVFGFGKPPNYRYMKFSVVTIFSGYADNAPAPAPLQIYNPSASTFAPTFTPPAATAISQTLPAATQTTNRNVPTGSRTVSTGQAPPTSSATPGSGGGGNDSNSSSASNATAIAVGTSFGVMGLIIIGLAAAYYVRRHRRNNQGNRPFMALGHYDDEDGDSPHLSGEIPGAGFHLVDSPPGRVRSILDTLGIAGALSAATKMPTVRNAQYQRRDMLADEDTRSFGEWYNARRDVTAGSSWSLRSFFSGNRLRSRDASTTSYGTGGYPTPWREKSDPFSDGAGLMRDEETGLIGPATLGRRPSARREMSYASYASSRSAMSYRDPFTDPIEDRTHNDFSPSQLYAEHSDEGHDGGRPTVRQVQPTPSSLAPLLTVLPLSHQVGQTLSPLSEHTSQSTLPLQTFSTSGSSQAHSSENVPSPFTGAGSSRSRATSITSINPTPTTPGSPQPPTKSTSIVGAADPNVLTTNQPMRRSDSWWSRFARSSLLDRRSSTGAANRANYDIRDPNPAPRLVAIEEASTTGGTDKSSPGSGTSASAGGQVTSPAPLSRSNSVKNKVYPSAGGATGATGHGKSMSSLRTTDTAAIERMAGTMDVVQRVKDRSRYASGSTSSTGGLSIDTHVSASEGAERESLIGDLSERPEELIRFASPVDIEGPSGSTPMQSPPLAPSSPPSAYKDKFVPVAPLHLDDKGLPSTPTSPGKVSERVQAYERRMSLGQAASPPPTNTKQREERSKKRVDVDYGLVPRPSLFVANPDHRAPSGSETS
ncbi:hypothetical protein CVT26_002925 [Gymnopilus dilepis]|uniref:Galactose oxidase n=1 Tax=Gymnopilus dilepis TaxID=231916 RepID=A0A409VQU7_9AGAR|nr:hypothetical protein CVT26_002925 [Gymnopilus dilepis]